MEVPTIQRKKIRIRKDEEKSRAFGGLEKRKTELTPHKCFWYLYVDHIFAKYPRPNKDKKKWQNQVRFNERGNCALQKECNNGDNDHYQKIYTYMAQMFANDKSPGKYFSDSS